MPYVAELVGREVFCLGCGAHFLIPKLEAEALGADPQPLKPIVLDVPFPAQPPQGNGDAHPDVTKPKAAND